MKAPSTSRHVYRKIRELDELVSNFSKLVDSDLCEKSVKWVMDESIEGYTNLQFASFIKELTEIGEKIVAIFNYLSKFMLNSKQSLKVNYLNAIFTKIVLKVNNMVSDGEFIIYEGHYI